MESDNVVVRRYIHIRVAAGAKLLAGVVTKAAMASDVGPVSMVMTCDDAVEMMFMDGSRVQLSPCGSCFIFDPPSSHRVSHPYHNPGPGPSHPLYTSTRTQQRTCFVTSGCRSKVKAALEFRNRFASCPFLCTATTQGNNPLELYADINRVEWSNSSGRCSFSHHPDHSLELTSVDSLATVILSPSAQDFSVKYLCKLKPEGDTAVAAIGGMGRDRQQLEISEDNQDFSDLKCFQRPSTGDPGTTPCQDPWGGRNISHGGQHLKRESPEEKLPVDSRRTRCKFWYTWVVQNHSVAHCPWYWKHPLDLLRNHNEQIRKTLDVDESTHTHIGNDATPELDGNRHGIPEEFQTHSSPLPPSLPLSCEQSHLHKHHWRTVKQEYAPDESGEADTLTMYGRKVSVLFLGGVVYRLFWKAVPSIEIYPGNGDVIISHDERGSFFKLVKVCSEGSLKELMISVTSPPPDTPHSSYSIVDLVRRGSRLLQCISVHQRTIGVGDNLCCWKKMEKDDTPASASILIERSIIPGLGQLEAYSNGLIRGYFNDDVTMETIGISQVGLDGRPVDLQIAEDETVFTVVLAGGCHRRVNSQNPGAYLRHINALLEWKRWVSASFEERCALTQHKGNNQTNSNGAVQTELLRIRNLTYIIDASNDGRTLGFERHNTAIKENEIFIKDNDGTPVTLGTDLGRNGEILHSDQSQKENTITKDDIARALRDTALTPEDDSALHEILYEKGILVPERLVSRPYNESIFYRKGSN